MQENMTVINSSQCKFLRYKRFCRVSIPFSQTNISGHYLRGVTGLLKFNSMNMLIQSNQIVSIGLVSEGYFLKFVLKFIPPVMLMMYLLVMKRWLKAIMKCIQFAFAR